MVGGAVKKMADDAGLSCVEIEAVSNVGALNCSGRACNETGKLVEGGMGGGGVKKGGVKSAHVLPLFILVV